MAKPTQSGKNLCISWQCNLIKGVDVIGHPAHLNTKYDYEYVRKHFPEAKWKPAWQALLDTKDAWLMTSPLKAKEAGVTDATHKVVEVETMDGKIERYQCELKEDPNALVFRKGFKVAEVEAVLAVKP